MDLEPAHRRVDVFHQIRDHVLEMAVKKRVIPIITLDETQMYHYTTLEFVRFILSFEVDSRNHAILVLCGQLKLGKRLRHTAYEPLTQQITVQHRFRGLDREEVERYLRYRLDIAGVKHQLFEPDSVQYIYQVAKGNLRKL